MNPLQGRLLALIICAQAASVAGESLTPSIELLEFLCGWQPEDAQWLQKFQQLDELKSPAEQPSEVPSADVSPVGQAGSPVEQDR